MTEKVGRPGKYNKDMQDACDNYVENHNDYGDVVPSIEGLSLVIDVCTKTIHNWKNEEISENFLHTLDKIRTKQKNITMQKGLAGEFNAAITKLILHNHGLHDKQDVDHSGAIDLSGKTDEELKAILAGTK